ncbi:MAG: right-handed parallel beta-helix repeat-containing protein [Spirochaetales bacterium]|nr:right-handed parallel beta-helix repeat-containing protein [Spirochaetales bacterium]
MRKVTPLLFFTALLLSSCGTLKDEITLPPSKDGYHSCLAYLQEKRVTILDEAEYGADNREYIQSLLDSDVDVVIIPAEPGPWFTGPLFINRDNLTIIFEPGAQIHAVERGFRERNDSLITIQDRHNITLKGFGGQEGLYMRKEDYRRSPYQKSEWRHCLSLRSTTNVLVEGLTLGFSGGDGIYVGLSKSEGSRNCCLDTVIRDCTITDNFRQGISVISAENLLIENTTCRNTGGTLPKAGIDFEPNNPQERLINCRVVNSRFLNNRGPGIHIYLKQFNETTLPLDLYFEENYCRGNLLGIGINLTQLQNNPRGRVTFVNNDFGTSPFNKIPQNRSLEVIFVEND